MDDETAIPLFIGICITLFIVIGAVVYFTFNNLKKSASKALALSPIDAKNLYLPSLTNDNLLYSVSINLKHTIRNTSGDTIATITYPRAQKTLCRMITMGNTQYECHLEHKLTHTKVHLYDAGANPEESNPLLTFQAGITNESYTKNEAELYSRRLLERHAKKGWPIFQGERIIGYVEALYPTMKAHAFMFQALEDIPLIEQLFIIAMSDRQV